MRKYYVFLTITGLLIITLLVLGFVTVTNPVKQRNKRIDNQTMQVISEISEQVNTYFDVHDTMPSTMDKLELTEKNKTFLSKNTIDYKTINKKDFELCANFLTENDLENDSSNYNTSYYRTDRHHKIGYDCIKYSVSPL